MRRNCIRSLVPWESSQLRWDCHIGETDGRGEERTGEENRGETKRGDEKRRNVEERDGKERESQRGRGGSQGVMGRKRVV